MGFFDRLSTGMDLAGSSWRVLRAHKQLVVFPALSGLACLLVLSSFALPFLAHPQWLNFLDPQAGFRVPPWAYAVAFAYYFCTYFVIVFFNSALVSCAVLAFNGEEPTLSDGLRAAVSRLPQILAWAAVSATVGVLLKVIENAHEKAGQIVSALLGTVWTVITFFVVPLLVVERLGPFAAIKRSTSILRKTWGESLGGNMGIRFFLFLLALPGILLGVVGVVLMGQVPLAGLALLALAGIYFLVHVAVASAVDGIFLAAIYQFAACGRAPRGFRRSSMEEAFVRK